MNTRLIGRLVIENGKGITTITSSKIDFQKVATILSSSYIWYIIILVVSLIFFRDNFKNALKMFVLLCSFIIWIKIQLADVVTYQDKEVIRHYVESSCYYEKVELTLNKNDIDFQLDNKNILIEYGSLHDLVFKQSRTSVKEDNIVCMTFRFKTNVYNFFISLSPTTTNRETLIEWMKTLAKNEIAFEEYDKNYKTTRFLGVPTDYDDLIDELGTQKI